MTNIVAMPIYGKNRKNLLLRNKKADDLETKYAGSGARVLSSLFKWWPLVDLEIFYGKIKFGPHERLDWSLTSLNIDDFFRLCFSPTQQSDHLKHIKCASLALFHKHGKIRCWNLIYHPLLVSTFLKQNMDK